MLQIDKDLMNDIKHNFSLNEYEAKLWAALLTKGVATAGELSEIGSVPRSRAYDVLESLEKKGFVITKIDKPIKYVAVSPNSVLDRLKNKVMEDANKGVEKIEGLKTSKVMQELTKFHTKGIDLINPHEVSLSVRGQKNIYNHLNEQISTARNSVVIATSSQGLAKKADELIKSLKKAKQNGAKIKIAAPINDECSDAAKELSKFADVKDSRDFNARFSIVDGKAITYMILDHDQVDHGNDLGIHSNSSYFAGAVEKMFDEQFSKMKKPKLK